MREENPGISWPSERREGATLTARWIVCDGTLHVFSENDSQTAFQVPVDMTMYEPRSRIVSDEAERNIVSAFSDVDYIAADWILEVIFIASSDTNDIECMPVQVNWVLE